MAKYEFDHVHIFTKDLEQTVSFYKNILQAKELRRIDENGKYLVHLSIGNARIVISPSEPETSGIHHFAIRANKIEEALQDLKDNGFVVGDKDINSVSNYQNVFIEDNNGVRIEFIHPSTK